MKCEDCDGELIHLYCLNCDRIHKPIIEVLCLIGFVLFMAAAWVLVSDNKTETRTPGKPGVGRAGDGPRPHGGEMVSTGWRRVKSAGCG